MYHNGYILLRVFFANGCDSFDTVELADVTLVCFSMAKHFDINLIDEMQKKMKVNEKRND